MDENLKNILKNIWQDKPLLIAVLAGLAVVIYIVYKNGAGGAAAATTAAAPVLSGTGVTYVEGAGGGSVAPTPAPQPIVSIPVLSGPPRVSGPGPVAMPMPSPAAHAPGTTFLGSTGVKHYVANGTQTLSQIAAKFGLKGWNSIYAIPDNMSAFRKIWGKQARPSGDVPPSGLVITLPSTTIIGF